MASAQEVAELRNALQAQAQQIQALLQAQQQAPPPQPPPIQASSLVDTRLLTKPGQFSGDLEGKERWSTWSFKIRAYCAALHPRLAALMESAASMNLAVDHGTMAPEDVQHSTTMYYLMSLLTEGEALDIVRNAPVHNGLEVWRCMVGRWGRKSRAGSEACCRTCSPPSGKEEAM